LAAAVSGTQLRYQSIWDRYFPRDAQQQVQSVWNNIISDTSNPGTGTDILQWAQIIGIDISKDNVGGDPCAEGYDAYTVEIPPTFLGSDPQGSTISYFCDRAFTGPQTIGAIACSDLDTFASNKMDFLGATILHEWMHNDNIGAAATGSHIIDVNDIAGYGAYATQQLAINDPASCINNADSFTWLALEVYWTIQCKTGSDRFDPAPAPPSVTCFFDADPDGAEGYCPAQSSSGWCDCGDAGLYVSADSSSGGQPCPYTTQPNVGNIVLQSTDCASQPTCGPNDMSVDNANAIGSQLWANVGQQCCNGGTNGCMNIESAGGQAADLCTTSAQSFCVDCGILAFYVNTMISTCQSDGQVGGVQNVAEAPGMTLQM